MLCELDMTPEKSHLDWISNLPGGLADDEAPKPEQCTHHTLAQQWQAPRVITVNKATEIIHPNTSCIS